MWQHMTSGMDSSMKNGMDSSMTNGMDSGMTHGMDGSMTNGMDSGMDSGMWLECFLIQPVCSMSCLHVFLHALHCLIDHV